MTARLSSQFYKRPFITGLIVFTGLLVLVQMVAYQRYLLLQDSQIRELSNAALVAKEKLEGALNNSSSATQTLSFWVKKYGVEKDFDELNR